MNLSFLSKVIEKCVAKQLIDYLDTNDLHVIYQSAYRKLHSTETALIRVNPHLTLSITLSYFHAFLIDLELEVRHWSGFDRI